MREGPVWAILLAAGQGRRFGGVGNKLLATFRGRPLIGHPLETLRAARNAGILAGIVAVLPRGNTAVTREVEGSGARIVENSDPSRGLASSLALGFRRLAQRDVDPEAGAALIVLGDQPMLRLDAIGRLVEAWRQGDDIVRPVYDDAPATPGHPVVLDRSHWGLVRDLAGDHGLGRSFSTHPDRVTILPLPGTNPDIDTAADLAALEDTP